MKRFKMPFFAIAMLIALSCAFAFNVKPVNANATVTTYYYVGPNSLTGVQTPANWEEIGDPCFSNGSIPCSLDFNGMNRADFDAHIANYISVAQAKDECTTKRNS